MVGNWSGKYDDGMAPYAWNGSAAILEEFLKKRKGVKFGQCWTFSAVATTGRDFYCYKMYRIGIARVFFLFFGGGGVEDYFYLFTECYSCV